MWNQKKKSPSVKIPASVLRREAQKMAKKMMLAEEKKERARITRERAKEKAKAKLERQKARAEKHQDFVEKHITHEVWGTISIIVAFLLMALFMSGSPTAQTVTNGFQFLFGIGMWILPFATLGYAAFIFMRRQTSLPAMQWGGLLFFYASILGIINLWLPSTEMLAQSKAYGGALGFALTGLFREFLGDAVTVIILVGILIVAGMIGFRIRLSDILGTTKQDDKPITTKPKSSPQVTTEPTEHHFENDLEIIDSTRSDTSVELEPSVDPLTEAKNKAFGTTWEPPSIDILKENTDTIVVNEQHLRDAAEVIRVKLEQFGIQVTMKAVHVGPTVTQFTLEPAPGVKLTKITGLKSDLALALAAESVRIEAPIRGKALVGIEIPNEDRAIVGMREILTSDAWEGNKEKPLSLAVGRDVAGKPFVVDLAKMPHLLIAGKTGSGKSVGMNAFLCSLLWKNAPEDLKLILIDPKRVELKPYDNLPHLLTSVIVEPEKAVSALAWAVAEMNRRYKLLSEKGVRDIKSLNEKYPEEKEPHIVIVIDELADLMMAAGKDVEAAICRIAQMARAVGMHLVIATQRPSVDVVTGLIKANLPSRIAFKVSSGIDSRTIIDGVGAEDLLGFGDMLYLDGNSGNLSRIQGIYITEEEIKRITNHIKLQFPEMIANDQITNQSIEGMAKGGVLTAQIGQPNVSDEDLDDLYRDAVSVVLENNKASASFLQRRLEIGYARAARILDQMESRGVIGPSRGAKAREIYGVSDN